MRNKQNELLGKVIKPQRSFDIELGGATEESKVTIKHVLIGFNDQQPDIHGGRPIIMVSLEFQSIQEQTRCHLAENAIARGLVRDEYAKRADWLAAPATMTKHHQSKVVGQLCVVDSQAAHNL